MQVGDRSYKAESEAVARGATASLQPVEKLEYAVAFIDGNSWPVIGHRNQGSARALADRHSYPSRFATMLDGVVHQIGERLEEQVATAGDPNRLIADRLDMAAPFLRRGIEQLGHFARERGQIDGAEVAVRSLASIYEIRMSEVNMPRTASRSAMVSAISD
jgi:hypothetical protein